MVAGPFFDLDAPVDLLEEDEAGKLVGKGERRKGDGMAGLGKNLRGETVGAADDEGKARAAPFPLLIEEF